MCTVSMVTDHYTEKWGPVYPSGGTGIGGGALGPTWPSIMPTATEIAEFHKLLQRAREYDKANNEPNCELESKKTMLKEIAEHWGIDISFIDTDK